MNCKKNFISFTSIVFASLLPYVPQYTYAKENINASISDEETELINLLPSKYRQQVTDNLLISDTNKAQLLLAIKNTNQNYREGLGHILANMPAQDLKQLSSQFLIENIELAYKVKY